MKTFISFCTLLLMLVACNAGSRNEVTVSDSASADAPSPSSQESREERNKQVAMESVRAVLNNNPDDALKNATPDAVDYSDGSGQPTKGVDSIKAGMRMWLSNVQDYKADNLEAIADGNKVMVYGDWSGTFKNNFMGTNTAGKSFKVKDVDIFTFTDEGKISEHRSVQSIAGLMSSMGK